MKIIIDEELCTKIEMLQYEVFSRKEVITTYLNTSNNASNDLFKAYQNEYKEYFTQYNKAKQEMTTKYGVPTGKAWNLDFATRELTISE
jgi:hypothetical protein